MKRYDADIKGLSVGMVEQGVIVRVTFSSSVQNPFWTSPAPGSRDGAPRA